MYPLTERERERERERGGGEGRRDGGTAGDDDGTEGPLCIAMCHNVGLLFDTWKT